MDWNKGFSAACYACIVDPVTWCDMEKFDIKDGTITKSASTLIEAADILADTEIQGEKWIRVHMDAQQEGASDHTAVFTGLATAPQQNIRWSRKEHTLECYSVLKPAEDILLPRGYYIPAGTSGKDALLELLGATPAPVEVEDIIPKLMNTIVAEQGENNLSMVVKVLKAVDRRIRIKGDGTIWICNKAMDPAASFDAIGNDCIEPSFAMTNDWFSCPNVLRVVTEDQTVTVIDDDEDSALSTVKRGREVWMEETDCILSGEESLEAYAQRRLKEEQAKGYEISYSRRFNPEITISDIVKLRYPEQKLNGNYRVIAQRIDLGHNCRTEEQVEYC